MLETKILVVEDEALVAEDIRRTLQNMGYNVPATVSSGEAAIKKVEEINPDLALMDIVLRGEMDGIETAGQITSRFNIPVVYLTAYSDKTMLERAKITEPFGYLNKPFKEKELKMAIDIALFKHRTEKRLRASENKYRILLENLPQKIFQKDKNLHYVSCNNNFARDLKIKPDEIAGKTDYDFFSKDLAEKYRTDDKRIMESGRAEDIEEKYVQDGQEVIVHTVKTPIKDENGNTTGVLGIFWDITERKRSEEKLVHSEEKYRTMIEHSNDMIWTLDKKGNFIYFNKRAEEITGYKLAEWQGKSFAPLALSGDLPRLQKIFIEVMAGKPQQYEVSINKIDGSILILSVNTAPIYESGTVAGTVNFGRDITERKRDEKEIQRRSQIQASLNKLLQISLQDISLKEILEQVIDHLISVPWLELQPIGGIWMAGEEQDVLVLKAHRGLPDSLQTVCARVPFGRCICGRAASSGKIECVNCIDDHHENKYPGITPHGHYCVPLMSSGRVLGVINLYLKEGHRRDEKEEEILLAIADVLVGIIQRKLAEEALLRSNEFSKTVLDSMNDALCIINVRDFKIAGFNSVFLRQFGQREEDIIGKTCYHVTHHISGPCQLPDDICPLLETVKTAKHSAAEHLHYTKNGEKMYVEVSASPILDEKGRITQVVHISRDITERKLAEERLKQANIELKKADELKTQFLSVVSHELRTPITPMNAQLQMILAGYFGDVTENQRKSLEMIRRNTTRLDRLIGDVLDISKLEAGVMKFNMALANLNEIVENAVETMKIQACNKDLKLTLKEDKIPEITVDKDRITQVIINLINNAIKFTDTGGEIEVELSGSTDNAVIKVKDNGIGIKKEDQDKLFKPFQQVDSSYTRKFEGTGLGLAICLRIVTYHGGKIRVESEPGKGSTFQFIIPYNSKIKEEAARSNLFEKYQK